MENKVLLDTLTQRTKLAATVKVTKVIYGDSKPVLNWGYHPSPQEGNRALTPVDWAEGFGHWFIDYYVNEIALPAAKARAKGKPDAELEARRDLLCVPYAYPDEPSRINWTAPKMEELWSLFLDDLSMGWLLAWGESGLTLKDLAVAFLPEDRALCECARCSGAFTVQADTLKLPADVTGEVLRVVSGEIRCPQCRKVCSAPVAAHLTQLQPA